MIICATGHRPQFCPCLFDENHQWLLDLKLRLKQSLQQDGPEAVICGGAIGMDTWMAECVVELGIPLHLYLPFEGQELRWPSESRNKYNLLKNQAAHVRYINNVYTKSAFLDRDRAMVDDADTVYALLNPEANSGGTFYTVAYAKKLNRRVVNFWTGSI